MRISLPNLQRNAVFAIGLACLMNFLSFSLWSQVTIADALPGCLDANISSVGIGCGGGTTVFGVTGNIFVVNNVDGAVCCSSGGDNESYFEFEVIDISSYTNISISMEYFGSLSGSGESFEDEGAGPYFGCTGTVDIDNGHDQIVFAYSLNGAPFVQSLYVHGTTAADFTGTWNVSGLNGNSLRVRVWASNKAGHETFNFTNFEITGFPTTVNAGADQSVCGTQSVTLNGSGAGSWSGGSGFFLSPTNPNTSYTPSGLEVGSTVNLTYSANAATLTCAGSYPPPSDIMALTVLAAPDVDDITDVSICGTYTLPSISGTNLTGSEAYYTGAGGTGTSFANGDLITSTTTLFIYDSAGPSCSDEESFTVTISAQPDITPLNNTTACGSFSLPTISGTNLTGSEAYYTGPDGTGTSFSPGDDITSTTTLFIYDSAGPSCSDEESFTITVTPGPNITAPADETACNSFTLGTINGTNLTGSEAYFTGPNGTGTSLNTGQLITTTTTLFVYDSAGPSCDDEESFTITINTQPDITAPADATACNSFTLETINGINLTGSEAYYTGPNGTGTSFGAGQSITTTTTLFAYNSAGPSCTDEESFTITITPQPDITAPTDETVCNSFTLGVINGTNLTGSEAYFTGPNGTGTSFIAGQPITTTTTLFAYDSAGPSCDDEESFTITINPQPDITAPADETACNSFTLGAINGTNLTGSEAYFTGPNGTGTSFIAGQPITTTTTLFAYDNAGPSCTDEESFTITINPQPDITAPVDETACNSFTLSAINGTNLTGSEAYFTGPNGTGTSFIAGQPITTTTTLFAYDSAGPSCDDEESFTITITPQPDITAPSDVTECGSYTLAPITGTNLTGTQAYFTGPNGTGSSFAVGQTITSSTTLFIYDSAAPGCSDEESFNVNITPNPDVFPIVDADECGQYILPTINGVNFTGLAAYYTGPGGTGVQFLEGEAVTSSIQLFAYTGIGACSDEETFFVNIGPAPDINPIADEIACGQYTLPAINGTGFTGIPAYYTGPGGTGIQFLEGETVNNSIQLFAYNGSGACSDEESFFVTITAAPSIDPIADETVCGQYILPVISGMDFTGLPAYYTSPGGTGVQFLEGEIINNSIQLFAYNGSGTCSAEESFFITINPNPEINPISDENVCGTFILPTITGTNLTGNQYYSTQPNGQGTVLMAGDTITSSNTYYAYDDNGTCSDEEPFNLNLSVSNIDISCAVIADVSAFGVDDGIVEITIDAPTTSPYTITWTGSENGNTITTNLVTQIGSLAAGAYSFTVTDADGCSDNCSLFIENPACTFPVDVSTTPTSCVENSDGSISLMPMETTGLVFYFWNDPSLNGIQNPTGLAAGNYTVTIADIAGCEAIVSAVVEASPGVEISCSVTSTASGPGVPDGAASIDISGGTAPYTIEYVGTMMGTQAGVAGPNAITGLSPGVYIVFVTDVNGCTSGCSFFVGDCGLIANLEGTNPGCVGEDSGSINVVTSGGAAPLTYDWSDDTYDGMSMISNLTEGGYTVTVTDNNNCQAITNIVLEDPQELDVTCNVTIPITTFLASEGEADVLVNGGTPPYIILLDGPFSGGDFLTSPGVATFSNLPGGIYETTVTDFNGCESTCSFVIQSIPCPMTADFIVSGPLCEGDTGSIQVILNNETGPVLFDWSRDSLDGLQNPTGLPIATYGLTITDNAGCIIDTLIELEESELRLSCDVIAEESAPGAADGFAEIEFNGEYPPFEITWTGPVSDSQIENVAFGTIDLTNLVAGEYTVTLKDSNSCTTTCTFILNEELCGATFFPLIQDATCPSAMDGSIDLTVANGNPPFMFSWGSGETTEDISGLGAGAYEVKVVDANGCDATIIFNVGSVNPAPTAVITADTTTLCEEDCLNYSMEFTGQSPFMLEYNVVSTSINQSFVLTSIGTDTTLELCPGILGITEDSFEVQFVLLTDALCSDSLMETDQISILNIARDTIMSDLCIGDSLIVNGMTYNETNPMGTEIIMGGAVNGCDSIIVVDLNFITASVEDITQDLCPGDSLIVNGITYNETNPMGSDTIPNGSLLGCDSIINVMLNFFPIDTFDLAQSLCPGDSLVVNGNTYNESNTSGIEIISGATSNGCDSVIAITLTYLTIDTFNITDTLCPGNNIFVNGNLYDELTPSGTETISAGGANGCDSIIVIDLSFYPNDTTILMTQLCTGDSLIVNGTVYNEANPTGIELIVGGTVNGCDSIINVDLSFGDAAINDIAQVLCPGDSLVVNGTVYNESNLMGSDTIPNGSIAGCDSIINVMINYELLDTFDLTQQLCTGDSLLVNGTVYNEANPTGIEVIIGGTVNGCDSVININLSFDDAAINDINQTLCAGDSLVVNGTVYNELNPMGADTIPNGSIGGCDSIINVMLSFFPIDTLNLDTTLCPGETVIVNGVVYNITMPSGIEVIPGAAANGCDSIVNVNLSFFSSDVFNLNGPLCRGESITVDGTVYDESNPSGVEIISGATINGCDSIVNINLTFIDPSENDVVTTLCLGDSLIVNGTVYNESNPMGSDTIPSGSANGCDSIINVMLSFFPLDTFDLSQQLCTGDSLVVNGTTYNESNPSGIEVIAGATVNGCDSIINVNLSFGDASINDITQTICTGDSLVVNGITYNELNPMGSDTIPNGSIAGCDSIINVNLSFFPLDTIDLAQTLCIGDSLVVNGTVYNESNTSGIEIIIGGTINGCDSIVNVMLDFFPLDTFDLNQQLCIGDSLIVNGTTYNTSNATGIEILPGAGVNGCDSIINVILDFFPTDTLDLTQTLCIGDSLVVNGTTYNAANPTGLEVLAGADNNGCDSLINVMLSFFPLDTFDLSQQLCTGDSLIVNGTVYNETNPSGIEVIAGGTVNGCDSIINIDLTFGDAAVNDIDQTLCIGDSLIVNGITYNELNPMGSDTIPNGSIAGCDSIINIMLSFFSLDTVDINQQLCTGDSLVVNGTVYNEANPSGIEVITGGTVNGCDSIINVNLSFGSASINDITQTICAGDSLVVNGIVYNELNPMGSDTIPNGSVAGCDSIINVMLDFFPIDTFDLNQQLCASDSISINGTIYNILNPAGIEVLPGAGANGCDSIINVMLDFFPTDTLDLTQTLCIGDSLVVNGTTYNAVNPSGLEVLAGAGSNGCDSLINVTLSFFPVDTFDLSQQLCTGDSLVVNGTVYNEANPNGIEILSGVTVNGCDSIINVNLTFGDAAINDITQALCAGDSLVINGITYNEVNPMGSDTIPNGSVAGCDSIINIMLSFFPLDTVDINQQLCTGDSLVVNGTVYNEANPSGVEVIAGGTVNGCDSIINVNLSFGDASINDIAQALCAGDSLVVNGITYNELNPMGSDTIPNGSVAGCDSIINVMLSFFPIDTFDLNQNLCVGDSLIVNGTTYNASNQSGLEVLSGAGANGCDSVINVMLNFFPIDTLDINQQLCTGDSLLVNGTVYNEANPTGTEIITGGTVNGCDSVIIVNLSFGDASINDITQTLCVGDSVVVNGTVYNELNPMGSDTIPNGSVAGCDSIVNVMLSFFPVDTFDLREQLCTGDSLIVNGTVYNEANSSGLEIIPGGTINGCDSIISVNLGFGSATINDIVETLCPGDSLVVNGIVYDELNPMGADTIPNGSVAGCDSIINVTLDFFPLDTFDLSQQLCTGDSLVVNGTVYNETNPSGIEILAGGTINGCDSIINVSLTFGDASINDISQTICTGDSLVVNGVVYDELNPMGSDTIPNGSIAGCDSIINVMLSFFPNDTTDITDQLCLGDSLVVNGTVYNASNPSGVEIVPGGSVNGCDVIINVNLTFDSIVVNEFMLSLCPGDSIEINGVVYNEMNPIGTDTIPDGAGGCDSIIEVMLSFFPLDTVDIIQQLCTGDSLIVNGTVYNETNPSGIEVIPAGTVNGCDSIINVNLSFGDAAINDIVQTICIGDSVVVNGTVYNELNSMGADTIPNGSVAGCDSIINVMLNFFPVDTFDLTQQLCTGDSLIVNGTVYNESNPTGIEVISGGTVNGCDSIINVDLSFGITTVNDIVQTICSNDSLVVNGIVYNAQNPMGTDTIPNGNTVGCDSIINIMLSFFPIDTFELSQTICVGDSLVVNGTVYNETNPSGIEVLPGADANGCDSIINIMLSFDSFAINDIAQVLCLGDSLVVNGVVYNELNPMGADTIPNGSVNGCDSIINVMLTFFPVDTFDITQQLCVGDSIIVNGTTYDESNPTGIEVITDGTANGCDSIINIMLTFFPSDTLDIVQQLCPGDSIVVNGTTYDESNPTGTEIIAGGTVNGCDSIVNVMLEFFTTDTLFVEQQLCTGDSLIVNGMVYNASNPSGVEIISGGTINGCDSIISVNLMFDDAVIEMIMDTLCIGESITVNGQIYDEQNPMGEEVIENGSAGGCDSIIMVNLSFFPQLTGSLVGGTAICEGDSATLTINLQGNDAFNVTINNGISDIETFNNITDGFTFTVQPTNTTTYTISNLVAIGNNCQTDIGDGATVTVESVSVDVQVTSDFDGFGVSCPDSEDGSVMATAVGDNISYQWNTGATTSEITGLGAGTYIVTVTTATGCIDVDSAVIIAPNPIVTKITGIEANCLDPLSGSIFIESLAGGTPPFEFSLDGTSFQSVGDSSITISNVEPGTYDVVIQDANGCQTTTQVFVGEAPELTLELGNDEEIKLGDSLLLSPIANFAVDTFFWSPFEGLSDPFSFTPLASPTITTTYQLTALDSLGCVAIDQVTIFVNTITSVYVPTAFSPNEDGRNDFFTIFAGNNVEEVTIFRIFDRWGNMVFEAGPIEPNNELLGWDGNFNGEPMDPAVFVYYAEIRYVDGREEVIKGDITLVR